MNVGENEKLAKTAKAQCPYVKRRKKDKTPSKWPDLVKKIKNKYQNPYAVSYVGCSVFLPLLRNFAKFLCFSQLKRM